MICVKAGGLVGADNSLGVASWFGIQVQNFVVEPLAKDQIAAAYPLIREAVPSLDLPHWTRLARRLTEPRRAAQSGILVVRRRHRRHACGLFYYRKEQDLQYGTVLVANHFVALDLLDQRPVAMALVAALERLAQDLGCRAIRSVLHAGAADMASELYQAGHTLEGATLCKPLFDLAPPGKADSPFAFLVPEDDDDPNDAD